MLNSSATRPRNNLRRKRRSHCPSASSPLTSKVSPWTSSDRRPLNYGSALSNSKQRNTISKRDKRDRTTTWVITLLYWSFHFALMVFIKTLSLLTVKRAQRKTETTVEAQGPQERSRPRGVNRQAPRKYIDQLCNYILYSPFGIDTYDLCHF